jgi:two-component system, OmpR family, copper resistance phosphate regulon response regulator CusR
MPPRILVVEDDELIASFIEKGLRARGFVTLAVDDGDLAIELSLGDQFDLVILDLALPGRGGFDVLQRLRSERRRIPVIILPGRPELRDVVQCLDVGADDYMTKPFRFEELLARIHARLRAPRPSEVTVLRAGRVQLDLLGRRATVGERRIDLTAREFALVEMFMRHPGQVLTRGQILSHVWGYESEPGTNVVNVYVAAVRKKLGEDVIESVRGVGYRFTDRPLATTAPLA